MPPPSAPVPKNSRSRGLPFNLVARFSRQMKPQRLYPLVVRLRRNKKEGESAVGTLHLRPVIPGAIVTPADYTLDVDHPETNPPFYVTPLAKGRLGNARLEVFQQGRLVGTIALPMKAVRQTFTWFLLFLTIAIPCTTYWLARHTNFTRTGAKVETNPSQEGDRLNPADEDLKKKSDEGEGVRREKEPSTFPKLPKIEGEVERAVMRALPESSVSQTVAGLAQDAYEAIHYGPDYNLSFYVAAILLGFTCMSWAMHTTWGCRRKARPIH